MQLFQSLPFRPATSKPPIKRCAVSCLFALCLLISGRTTWAAVTIGEFLAANDGLLRDEDLQSPDWIELYNTGPDAVDLGGWHLTDDTNDLTQWTFPSTNLPAGGSLVVFASGKNRAVAGRELHANFQLNNDGEFLALVEPDGVTVAHAYAPAYPNQRANVSYGLLIDVTSTPLIASGAAARVFVPADGSLGTTWTAAAFNDVSWFHTNTPVAFADSVSTSTLLSLDMNERAQNPATTTMAGFTPFVMVSNLNNTALSTPTTRTYGGTTVTISNTPGANYDDRLRNTPGNSGAFNESLLLRDFIFSVFSQGANPVGGLDVAISGLSPNATHRLTVWSFDGFSFGTKISDWYANGTLVMENYTFNSSTPPTSNEQYRFSFLSSADGLGRILVSGRRDAASSGSSVFVNALRIESVTTLPPTGAVADLMFNNNASAFIRVPFNVSNPAAFENLRLRIRYNDGFVAYLNGQLVASRNAPGSPQWNSSATAARLELETAEFEEILLANTPGLLQTGANVLAIHGMNVSADDTTFAVEPELAGLGVPSIAERYFTPPTPGSPNANPYLGLVADTKFSVDRGFYDVPFTVAITSATANASIYWTTNGSIPSPGNGTLYTGPVSINGTRILRAAAFLADHVPSVPDAQTYIFLSQVLQQPDNPPGYPTVWPQGDFAADYGMDPAVVNHPNYGATISNDLRAIPTLSLASDHDSFWHPSTGIYMDAVSDRGERAASAELFTGDNTSEFQINCAVQMHGQAGRDNERTRKHSFRLEFTSDYGPSRLNYNWFGGGVDNFDSIILRNSWADTWTTRYDPFSGGTHPYPDDFPLRYRPENGTYLRDIWVKQAMRDMGHLASRSRYVHLYLNGLYWGIYAAIERHDTTYFAQHLGGYEKDWDVVKDRSELQDGSRTDWDNLIALVNAGINNDSAFQAVAAQVDIDNLIDYFLLHALVEANDWLQISNPHNSHWARRRANPTNGLPATKWIFLPWDQEIAFNRLRDDDRVNGLSDESLPSRIYNELRNYPEFRRMYGDRVQKHMFNTGALSPSANVARLKSLAAEINRAIVGESARWGDVRRFPIGNDGGTGVTLTRDEYWIPELQKLYTNWFPNVMHQRTIARLQAAGLFPMVGVPQFSQFGGAVSNRFDLELTHTNATGAIFYTVDGTDPRVYGTGATAPGAQAYEEPILFNGPTVIRARARTDVGEWSALVEAVFFPPQDLSRLCLNEIMYNPPSLGATNGNDLEFLELKNYGTNTINLSGLTFSDGINFTFTNGTLLAPGEFFVLARNAAAFATKYPGVPVNGTYTGQLDNAGERLTLTHPLGGNIFSVTYDDRPPWPAVPDLADFSLVPVNPGTSPAPDRGFRWRASAHPGGSPGADDPAPFLAPIVIEEILTHTDLPEKDSVELYNPTATNVNVGGWFLTDDADVMKYRIPDDTVIPAGGRMVFDEDDFYTGAPNPFRFSSEGDGLYLYSSTLAGDLTGYEDTVEFGGAFNGVSFGRYVNSAGEEFYPQMETVTLGTPNSGPIIGPVVISEIHYHPDAGGDEFLELLNLTGDPVRLFNQQEPTNTWRINGIGFTFPTNVTLGGNAMLLVVETEPDAFRAKYNLPTNVMIFGPYSGALDNSGENIELRAPDNTNTNGVVPYVVMDAVRYSDRSPWPAAADGGGPSLQRVPVSGYGNEPLHWIAAVPTPGAPAAAGDSDSDGIPDSWMIEHFGHPTGEEADQSRAGDDADGDGMTNWEEYLAGTNPNDAASVLRLDVAAGADSVSLEFVAVANRTYTIVYKLSLQDASWLNLAEIPASPMNRVVNVTNAFTGNAPRFYRLATPIQP